MRLCMLRAMFMCAWFGGAALGAPVSPAFTFQGQLKEEGRPLNGVVDLTFDFFDVESGGVSRATQSFADVTVQNGLFTVLLNGAEQAQQVELDGAVRWLEISVDGAPLSPRQPITTTPYATLSSKPWQVEGDNAYLATGNVGMGTDAPSTMLHLRRDFADTVMRFQSSRFQEGPPAEQGDAPGLATGQGAGQPWANPTNGLISDDLRSSVSLAGIAGGIDLLESQLLDLTDFDFNLPNQAIVVGITAQVEAQGNCSCSCDRCGTSLRVELIGGTGSSQLLSISMTNGDQTVDLGGTFETWGLEWTAAQINSADFGVRLRGTLELSQLLFCIPSFGCVYEPCDCTGSGQVLVDSVNLTVHYYDVSATTTPLDWTLGLSQNDSHFRVAPTADMTNPAIVATTLGNVGIGREPGFLAGPFGPQFYRLDVNGTLRCATVTTTSSRRFKQDVRPVNSAMDKLLALEGVSFRWDAEHGSREDVGFIAEDVGRVIPEIVDWETDGTNASGMRYDRITVYAVEAIKQLHADLKARDAAIMALQKRIEELERASLDSKPAGPSGGKGE